MTGSATAITIGATVCGLILSGCGARVKVQNPSVVEVQNLCVGAYGSETIVEFSGAIPSTFATGMDYPTGLAFNGSGDLFESDQFSGNIYKWTGPGGTRTTFAKNLAEPSTMAFNTAGDLFVIANSSSGSIVDEFSAAGVIIKTITGLSEATGLAFDSFGNLYIANGNGGGAGAGYIVKITKGGVRSTFASHLNNPGGIAFNAAGDLFIADREPLATLLRSRREALRLYLRPA